MDQTPPTLHRDAEPTRIDPYRAQMERVVTTPPRPSRKSLGAAGYVSQQQCVDGLCALAMHLIGTLRREAHLRHLYQGPRPTGPGRPKPDEGKVSCDDRSRVEHVTTDDNDLALSHPVVNHPQLKRHLRLVVVPHLPPGR